MDECEEKEVLWMRGKWKRCMTGKGKRCMTGRGKRFGGGGEEGRKEVGVGNKGRRNRWVKGLRGGVGKEVGYEGQGKGWVSGMRWRGKRWRRMMGVAEEMGENEGGRRGKRWGRMRREEGKRWGSQ